MSSQTQILSIVTSRLIRHRLPRQIALLLLVTVATVVGAAYFQLQAGLVAAAGDRASTAASRLAAALGDAARQLDQDLTRVTSQSAIRRVFEAQGALADSSRGAAVQALRARLVRSVVGVRLVDQAGSELASVGRWPTELTAPERRVEDSAPGLVVGLLESVRDTLYYAVTYPVKVGDAVRGSIIELRTATGTGGASPLNALIGSGAQFLVGNPDGQLWTNLERRAPGPSISRNHVGIAEYSDSTGVTRIGAAAAVAPIPWVAWVDFPKSLVLAPARRFLFIVGAIALLVVLVGGLGGWLVSRRIAGPLHEVSAAAEDIAAGDLARRVTPREDDEVGRLAACFNVMAERVENAHQGLERSVAERTTELEAAIMELNAAQETLVRKERLAMLGQLAGSVGHELRNPLGVMTNSLYLLSMLAPDDPPALKEYLAIMKGQVAISEKIVGDLLDFARVKQPTREVFSIGSLVAEQISRVHNDAKVPIRCEGEPGLPAAAADRGQVAQIVLNLITNAVQAVGEKPGTVTVRSDRDQNGAIRLDVIDTGCGIPTANLRLIFDPLFTTKARGIGLGLSVSRQLARANGGDISVTSEEGVGSTFSLTLPVAAAAA